MKATPPTSARLHVRKPSSSSSPPATPPIEDLSSVVSTTAEDKVASLAVAVGKQYAEQRYWCCCA
eukprot:3119135-Pyramimonas_sp.AAC.1